MTDNHLFLLKKVLRILWATLVVAALLFYFLFPEYFTSAVLLKALGENASTVLIFYILISSFRALLLLPSTIFVLLGVALYPNEPYFVLTVSMIGIMMGATLVYFSSLFLTPVALLGKSANKIEMVERKMEKYNFWIILFWSFFPAVPTDLICFVAGSSGYNYWKFFAAVFIGEIILVSVYVFTGSELMAFIY